MGTHNDFKKRRTARKERRAGTREPAVDSFLIVAEGEKTEPQYFEGLKRAVLGKRKGNVDVRTVSAGEESRASGAEIDDDAPRIDVKGMGMGTVRLVNEAASIASSAGINYQQVWVVFDRDDFEDFDEAIRLAESYGFEVAWTNQSFEYWLCLHFEYCDSRLDRSQWVDKIDGIFRRRGVRAEGYRKNLPDLYELMQKGSEDSAIRYAKRRRSECRGKVASKRDPCTTVDRLVEAVRKLVR